MPALRPLTGLLLAAALLIAVPSAGAASIDSLTAAAPSGSLTATAPSGSLTTTAPTSGTTKPTSSASSSKASPSLPYTGSDPRITLLIGVAALFAGAGLRLRTGDARDF